MENKYPVISKNGNKYYASVDIERRSLTYITVELYRVEKVTKGIFKKREVDKLIHLCDFDTFIMDEKYDIYKNNYVRAVKDAVEKYENKLEKDRLDKILADNNIKDFEQWDGKC